MATTSIPELHTPVQPRSYGYLKYVDSIPQVLLCGILLVSTIITVWLSWRWPLVNDAPIMQYAAFLIDHGKAHYKDIFDMNGPGAPLSSWLEIHLFGYSNLGWRIYDLLFVALGSAGILLICRPFGRVAVITSSCLLALTHIRLGMKEVGQRDFQMAVFELLGAGLLLQGFRTRKWGWFLASGIAGVLGATIKPPGGLYVMLFLAQAIVSAFHERDRKWILPVSLAAGAALTCAMVVLYLVANGAWRPFLEMYGKFLPLYSQIGHRSFGLLAGMLNSYIQPLLLLIIASGLLLAQERKTWFTNESVLVMLGAICGVCCFLLQAKAWVYQLGPFIAFAAVWCGMAIGKLMQDRRTIIRLPLALVLALWVVMWVPTFIRHTSESRFDLRSAHGLESEISRLRATGKTNGIQMMDTSSGAALALYDLKLVQSTSFLYDFFFYHFSQTPYMQGLRARFLKEMDASRPELLIISGQSWPDPQPGYNRFDTWPEFRNFLDTRYRLEEEILGYRIYVHR